MKTKITMKKTVGILVILFLNTFCYAQTASQTYNLSGSFTVPAGVTQITVESWGAGGKGGSKGPSPANNGYGGGGGGAYARKVITVIPGEIFTVTVGTGASTNTAPGNDSDFINSSSVVVVRAKGGNSVPLDANAGAIGGAGLITGGSIGDIAFAGGNGANGNLASLFGGGGGASAGTINIGASATNATGAPGTNGGGNGGAGRSATSGNGFSGTTPGGGGGGALRTSGTPTGGNGANGQIIVTYPIPEINLTGNAISIVDGDTTPSISDWTDFGSSAIGVGITRTFTIQNTGASATLTIGAISFSGTNAADFTVTSAPSSSVSASGNTTFIVTFTPSAGGLRTATLSIANNDSNENPYDFAIQGTGSGPEIDLQGNSISIVDGDTTPSIFDWTDFTATAIGVGINRPFTIRNIGTTALSIGAITFSGLNASEFTVTSPPATSIAAGASSSFTVTFNPSALGLRTATISIVNTDANENPYDYAIQGIGLTPLAEIDMFGNSVAIVDGDTTPTTADWTDFSTTTTTRTYTIQNASSNSLLIGAISFIGANAGDFSVTTPPATTITGGGSTTFVVTFNPSAIGVRNATILIISNDSNENPYDFAIRGTGVAQSMNVKGNNTVIADGDVTPSLLDWTDFDSTNIGSPITRVYTIENVGTMNLSLTGIPLVSISGSPDFTVVSQPTTPIQGLRSVTFIVRFSPLTTGLKTATISISNNDAGAGKNPYTFRVEGDGIQSFVDSDNDGVFNNLDSDDDNDGIPDNIEQNLATGSSIGSIIQAPLLNETFGTGVARTRINAFVPTASTTYCYEDGTAAQASDECDNNYSLNDGEYTVNYEAGSLAVAAWAPVYWYQGVDHTPSDVNGKMAMFNSTDNITEEFYRTTLQGVITNAPLTYSFYVLNLDRSDAPGINTRNRPNITVEFRDLSNNLISSLATGDIAPTTAGNLTGDWYYFSATFTPSVTGLSIVFRNNQLGGGGNDLALDDIYITQQLTDSDQDGIADVYDLDSDNDGIGGIVEDGWASLSNGLDRMDLSGGTWLDANGNGFHDTSETYYASNPPSNFDGDVVPNYIDLDSDNDALFDIDEAGLLFGDGDINCDGEGEGTDTDSDGILLPFDFSNGIGNNGKALPVNILGSGNPDYLKVMSKTHGVYDISNTLYASLDANNNGVIDGSADVDKDGILDTFDTNTSYYGSPRDLNRKLFLDFDGRNDYGQGTGVLNGLSNASLMAWINLNSTFSNDGVVIGQDKFHIRITNSRNLEAVVNSTVLSLGTTTLSTNRWYNVAAVFGGGLLKLYLNGNLVTSVAATGSITSDSSLLTVGKNPISDTKFFKGKIDEVRVFNIALSIQQLQRMVYQEIQNTSSQVRGAIIPKDIGIPFANLLRYYRMDAYKNDIIDDLTTPSIDTGTGMKIFNNKNIYVQQAPMPFVTERVGDFPTAVNSPTNEVRGMDIMDQDWSIVQVKHDITETANNIDLGMLVDVNKTITMNNDTKIQNDWYLKLDGKIDLAGRSQLVQTVISDLDPTSTGFIERDQQGQNNMYNYNYWSSPVGTINNTTNNNTYTVAGMMKDGSSSTPQNITWTTGLNGSPTNPITLSSYWIFKFQNLTPIYANWQVVGQNGSLLPGQGYTLKGSGSATNQNYTFVGKPNNASITSTIGPNNLNLIGNPYASALDANAFITANATTTTGALYFWEHFSTNPSHILTQYQGGYAARTLVGGTPPISPVGISGIGSSSKTPGRFVPVGQGFFIFGSATGGTVTLSNSQRLFVKENDPSSNTLFKNNLTNTLFNNDNDFYSEDNFQKIRLGFNDRNNYHRQILLGFMNENATSGIDAGYDAHLLDNQPNDFYFNNAESKLNISGEGNFNESSIYPLGVKIDALGTVTFSLDSIENFEQNVDVYIYDNLTEIYHDIKDEDFSIELEPATYTTRFSLRFINPATLSSANFENSNAIQIAYTGSNSMLTIKNKLEDTTVEKIELFNMLGQSVGGWNVKDQNQENIQIPIKNYTTGTYIVKIKTDKGDTSKKIIIN